MRSRPRFSLRGLIVACMIAVGIVALALDRALRLALRNAMPWNAQ